MNAAVLFAVWLSSAEPAVAGITMYQDSEAPAAAPDDLGNPAPAPPAEAPELPAEPESGPPKGVRLGIVLMLAAMCFTLWTWAAKRDDG